MSKSKPKASEPSPLGKRVSSGTPPTTRKTSQPNLSAPSTPKFYVSIAESQKGLADETEGRSHNAEIHLYPECKPESFCGCEQDRCGCKGWSRVV